MWTLIPKWPLYEAHPDGRIRVAKSRRVLRATPCPNGYMRVMLRAGKSARAKRQRVHVLILETFVGPRPSPRHHGAHWPRADKRNNRADNLEWKTFEENEADKKTHRSVSNGAGRIRRFLPRQAIIDVRAAFKAGESFTSIARRVGLHRHSVSRICRGLRRAEKPQPVAEPEWAS